MELNELFNRLDYMYDIGDKLDFTEAGAKFLYEGETTSRRMFQYDLLGFLQHISVATTWISAEQQALLNRLYEVKGEPLTEKALMEIAQIAIRGTAYPVVTVQVLMLADRQSRAQGKPAGLARFMLEIYDAFGSLYVSLNASRKGKKIYKAVLMDMRDEIEEAESESESASEPRRFSLFRGKESSVNRNSVGTGIPLSSFQGSPYPIYTSVINDHIEFVLPKGYVLSREQTKEGKSIPIIATLDCLEGEKSLFDFESSTTVNEVTITGSPENPIPPGLGPMEAFRLLNGDRQSVTISREPEADLMVWETPVNVLGIRLKIYNILLVLPTHSGKCAKVQITLKWDSDHPAANLKSFEHVLRIVKALRFYGKPLPDFHMTAGQLMEKLTPNFDDVASVVNGTVDLQIHSGDTTINAGVIKGDDEGNIYLEDKNHMTYEIDGPKKGKGIPDYLSSNHRPGASGSFRPTANPEASDPPPAEPPRRRRRSEARAHRIQELTDKIIDLQEEAQAMPDSMRTEKEQLAARIRELRDELDAL